MTVIDQYNHRVVTCTAVIPNSICWIDELLCGDHHVTTDELCSILSISKGTVMAVTEELGCLKFCAYWLL